MLANPVPTHFTHQCRRGERDLVETVAAANEKRAFGAQTRHGPGHAIEPFNAADAQQLTVLLPADRATEEAAARLLRAAGGRLRAVN